MEILSAFHQPRSNYGNCEQTAGAIGNNTRTCRGFYADARENHTLYILQRYLLQLITPLIRLQSRNGAAPISLLKFTAENGSQTNLWSKYERGDKGKAK